MEKLKLTLEKQSHQSTIMKMPSHEDYLLLLIDILRQTQQWRLHVGRHAGDGLCKLFQSLLII
jgi:hypothetical protein